MKISKQELNTLISLVVFGAAITLQQDDDLKISTQLKITDMVENIDTVSTIDDSEHILDLAIKLKEYLETNFKEDN